MSLSDKEQSVSAAEKDLDQSDQTTAPPSTSTSEDGTEYHIAGLNLAAVIAGLSMAIFLVAIDTSIVATAIPAITKRFDSTKDIGWYGSAFFLTICSFQPLAGKLFSLFSMKWVFLGYIVVFELGSLLCAVAVSSKMLIVGRAIAGAGGSGIGSGAFSIVALILPLEKRAAYIGILASMFGVATVIGPIIGGAFTQNVSWRWCFYINLPVGAFTVIALVLLFHPPRRAVEESPWMEKIKKLDIIGIFLFVPSIIMVLMALQFGGNTYAWNSPTIIGLFCGFGGLLLVFVAWQLYMDDDAMIPPSIIKHRTVIASGVTIACFLGSSFVSVYYLPEWFQVIKGASPIKSGEMNIPLFISQVIASLLSGGLVTKLGYYNPWLIAGTMLMSIGAGLYTTFEVNTNHAAWIGYQVISGLGLGFSFQMPVMAVQTLLPPSQTPVGMSIITFFQFFGSAIFVAIAQTVFSNQLLSEISRLAPGIDQLALLNSGSAAVRTLVTPQQLPAVLFAYNKAITSTFYVAAGAAAASVVTGLGIGWKSVKGKKVAPES